VTATNPRLKALHARLKLADARQINSVSMGNGSMLEFWQLRNLTIIVQDFGADGIEVYAPATLQNDVNAVYEAQVKSYALSQAGREACLFDGNLKECRAQLRAIARGELKACRTRYKSGRLHKLSADSYSVTIGQDRNSNLWTWVSLVII